MRVALAVGEGEEAGAGGAEGLEGVGRGASEVDNAHRISPLRSLSRVERREFRGSCPSTPLSGVCADRNGGSKKLGDENVELCRAYVRGDELPLDHSPINPKVGQRKETPCGV